MRIGIIGAGNFSSKVLEHLMAVDTLTVVGGYDSLVSDGFQSYDSLEDMLPEVDSVLVFDILYSSFASLSMVIKYGKNLYIETPGLCTNRELRNLEMLAYESGSVVQIGQKQRYYSFYDDLAKYDLTPRIMESSRFVKFNKKSTLLASLL